MVNEIFDLVIIGNGPAGMTAAIYAARYKINQLLVGEMPGGLMTAAHKICNYPSEREISGVDLAQKMYEQTLALNVPQEIGRVVSIKENDGQYDLVLAGGKNIKAKTILLATGTKYRHLGLPEEERFVGKGVSYCATCDAAFYRGKIVAIIGGSDSANTASLYLAQIAEKVYQIYRGSALRGETAWIDQVKTNNKIEVIFNTEITAILGAEEVTGLKLSRPHNGQDELAVNGIFVEVGSVPDPGLINELSLETDESGYVVTGKDQTASRPGVWAAGDITTGSDSFRQIITACAEGAVAAQSIYKYLQKNK